MSKNHHSSNRWNPLATRRLKLVSTVIATGLFGVAALHHPANASIPKELSTQENPTAKKRPGIRVVELCTIAPVQKHGKGRRNGASFGFTGPAHFSEDGRMTCYRARLAMRFRYGYSDVHTRNCTGRRYVFGALKNGKRYLVYVNAYTGRILRKSRVR